MTILMIALIGLNARSEPSFYGDSYIDIEAYGDGFAALGSDGTIHFFDSESRLTSSVKAEEPAHHRYMCSVTDAIVVADETSMSCLLDGRWLSMPVPEDTHIIGIDDFYGGVIAIAENGRILFWSSPFDNAQTASTGIEGCFTEIASYKDRCYAITDCSEIVSIDLALRTRIFNFNSVYSEYYGDVDIVSVATGSTSVCIAATRWDGSPAAFISSNGNVWSERTLDYLDGESRKQLEQKAITAAYREYDDCYVMLCEDGVIFHLPACSHCNYPIFTGSDMLRSIAFNGRSYLAVGEGIY